MKNAICLAVACAFAAMSANAATDPDHTDPISINGGEIELPTRADAPAHLDGALPEIYSGWLFRDAGTQQMQTDDFENPGMVFVDQGVDQWNKVEGSEGKSCASCHDDISESMKGVRASMPKISPNAEKLVTLEEQVNYCREANMGAEPYGYTSDPMINMVAAISMQSRGLPVDVAIDGDVAPNWERGKDMYYTRYGQLELSCSNCHEDHYGDWIRADHLSQGMTNGFPVYRLKDAGLVSIQGRFKGCIRDTRAETFAPGSDEFRDLELYVASRGNGLPIEGVGVRH